MKRLITLAIFGLISVTALASPPPTSPKEAPPIKEKADTAKTAGDLEHLFKHWVHSREEQKKTAPGVQIYRPANSKEFPPSRFRMAYKFSPNGECQWMHLHPADGHGFKSGKWATDADKKIIKITADGETKSFRIIEISKDILKLTPVEGN